MSDVRIFEVMRYNPDKDNAPAVFVEVVDSLNQ